jgi:uncharacterized integral membrane protein
MALLHREKNDEVVDNHVDDNRLGDERLLGDPPVGGPAVVDHTTDHTNTDRDTTVEREVVVDRASKSGNYGLIARTVVFTLAIVAVVGMAVANPDEVGFDLEFEQYSTPLWAIITIAAALGCIAGLMVRGRSPRSSTTLRR